MFSKIRSRMFIPDPGSWLWISFHPGSRGQKHRIPDLDPQRWYPISEQWMRILSLNCKFLTKDFKLCVIYFPSLCISQCCGGMFIPEPRSQILFKPGSRIWIFHPGSDPIRGTDKEFKYFKPKKFILSSRNQGVKKALVLGS
jgi:hypothetical protein